jgi:hypothetical protein
MTTASDQSLFNRRVLWLSAVLVGVVIAGLILFFVFVGRVDPLLTSAHTPSTTTIPT